MHTKAAIGIHIGHDRGAALVINGELVAQMAEERLDRRKHSNSPELPSRAIRAVLEIAGLGSMDIGTAGISYTNVVIGDVVEQLAAEVRDLLSSPSLSVHGLTHHECHAWSTYYTADFDSGLVLVADGAGDIVDGRIEAESLYLGVGDRLTLLERRLQDFGTTRTDRRNAFNLTYMSAADRSKEISLGRKYEQFTYLVGFGHGHAGKTMALASYADPLFVPEVPPIDGLHFSLRFEDGLVTVNDLWRRSGQPWHRFIKSHAPAIAASGQRMIEDYMVAIVESLERHWNGGTRNLAAAGGLFLSCRLNHEILARTRVERLHVVPAAGDDGQCVGAAFAAFAAEFGPPRRTSAALPYLGRRYDDHEIADRLAHFGLPVLRMDDKRLVAQVAADLERGFVVGLLRGRSEIGPRALCHRSLLADPRRPEMKDRLNRLKRRELFRPFAPVVMEEDQFRYFDLRQDSPYMLLSAAVRPEYRTVLPAITHVDGSARVQAVSAAKEPFLHDLLAAFKALTGHGVILNTSYNLDSEPIVESPHDAIIAYLSGGIDIMVLENYYVARGLPREDEPAAPTSAA